MRVGQAGYTPAYTTRFTYSPGQTMVVEGNGTTGALTHTYTLDGQGEVTALQDGRGDTTRTSYDAAHDVLTATDANGKTTTNAYQYVGPNGSTGLVTQTVRPALTSYVQPGNPSAPVTTRYRYDPTRYDLLETDQPAGGIILYGYDSAHSVMTTTALLKVTTSGLPGCPSGATRALHTATVTTASTSCPLTYHWRARVDRYDGYGERVAATDGRGVAVPDTQDTTGLTPTATLTDTQGLDTRHYAYDAQGDQTASGTPAIATTLNGITTTAPVTTTEGYDGDGNQTTTISANGNTTTLAYDHLGRQTSMTLPSVTLYDNTPKTPVETTGYDGDGNATASTDGNGDLTTSSYDPLGRQVSTTNPVSGTMLLTYTATELAATQDMAGNVSHDAYDGAGRLILASDPATGTVGYGYDPVGNTVAITAGDSGGNVTQLETRGYDAWDHVITDTVGGPGSPALTTLTAYDLDGNVAQVEQPNGNTTYNSYDLADQVTQELLYPHPVGAPGPNDAAYNAYGYDGAGNVTVSIDADGRSTTTTLDGDNRTVGETSITSGGATVITTTLGYDPDGNTLRQVQQTQVSSGPVQTHTITGAYNAADWRMSTSDDGLVTGYGYDAAGQQRSETIMNGSVPVTRTLDAAGRLTSVAENAGGTGPYTSTFGYNANDLPLTATLPNGVQQVAQYDPASRLTQLTTSGATGLSPSAYRYGYNAADWTTSASGVSGTDTLTHDAQGRLTSESGPSVLASLPGQTYRWTYDGNGNILTGIDDVGTVYTNTYSLTSPNQLAQSYDPSSHSSPTNTTSFAYDRHGDTTAITTSGAVTGSEAISTGLTYDAQERPLTLTHKDASYSSNAGAVVDTISAQYNAQGLRSRYTVVVSGTNILDQRFSYRAGGEVGQVAAMTATLNTNGTIKSSGAYTDTFVYAQSGEPLAFVRMSNGQTNRYWYLLDGRDNVVAVTDQSGNVVDRYAYDSWGEMLPGLTMQQVPQQLRYGSYWQDDALGWYWVTTRYYDPEVMRWMQPDPGEIDGVHTYVYVGDDPIDFGDPSGLCLIVLHSETAPFSGVKLPGYYTYLTLTENTYMKGKVAHRISGPLTGKNGAKHTTYVFEGKNEGYIGATLATGPESKGANGTAFTNDNRPYPGMQVADRKGEQVIQDDALPCSCYIAEFRYTAGLINHFRIPYNPLTANSNAVVYTLLNETQRFHTFFPQTPILHAPLSLKSGRRAPGLGLDLVDYYLVYDQPLPLPSGF